MAAPQNQRQILAGPSREELFDALRLRHEGRKVEFTMYSPRNPVSHRFSVNGISIEDGSGNNWILKLYFSDLAYYEAYYNTTKRSGWAKPIGS